MTDKPKTTDTKTTDTKTKKAPDPEMRALRIVTAALDKLTSNAALRVLNYARDKSYERRDVDPAGPDKLPVAQMDAFAYKQAVAAQGVVGLTNQR